MAKKYCFIINEETKEVRLGAGVDDEYYASIGMQEREVEQAYNGNWYLAGFAPQKPEETAEQKLQRIEYESGLDRTLRELILAENSGASEYTKAKAQQIENMALPLRQENKSSL